MKSLVDYFYPMKKRILVAVTNDLLTDQRVHRVCEFLHEKGHTVCLIGRKRSSSAPLNSRSYGTKRMRLLFERGPFFYAFFNIRLFFFILFSRYDIIVANDLDTLPACFYASKIRRKKLVYDTHEYFTEVPELIHRPKVQRTWERIEERIFPKLQHICTVNDSIAGMYDKKYGKILSVVRNIPDSKNITLKKTRKELGLPENKFILILQGAGINIDRGAEEAVEMMKNLENALLVIAGNGDVIPSLKKYVSANSLEEKVFFFPRMPYPDLIQYTMNADLGLTLDKGTNINYLFSLPNKLFDYIHAGIPVLASPMPEVEKIIRKYDIGEVIETHDVKHLENRVRTLMNDPVLLQKYRENTKTAAAELSWENEKKKLDELYRPLLESA
jgi:glycosyltransferase involved in cell wall biosynthesis